MVCMSPRIGYKKPAPADRRIARMGTVKPDQRTITSSQRTIELHRLPIRVIRLACRNTLELWVMGERVLGFGHANWAVCGEIARSQQVPRPRRYVVTHCNSLGRFP